MCNSFANGHALLVDLDGTLIDGFAPIVAGVQAALAAIGRDPLSPAEIRRRTGAGGGQIRALFGERAEEALQVFYRVHDAHLLDVQAQPGAEALLAAARGWGLRIAVVTNKAEPRARRQLAHLGLDALVDAVVGLAPGRRQKPDPHTLLLACARLRTTPAAAIMLGDGPADMQAACRAGCTALGLVGDHTEAELRQAGATACVHDLLEAKRWLAARFGG